MVHQVLHGSIGLLRIVWALLAGKPMVDVIGIKYRGVHLGNSKPTGGLIP